jgi:crotonobetainyl-CoA:carnitine CoA-transferase CaiB-like acyl-CoA transferase
MNCLLRNTIVLDLAEGQAGFCAKLLADLGATVIKVEGSSGDPLRKLSPGSFSYNNSNKLGVMIDLNGREGRRLFRTLAQRADVLVEAFPPGSSLSVDLAPQRLRRLNPLLIHISMTPFGRAGLTGACLPEVPLRLRGCQPHYIASLFGAVGAVIRLRKRKVTGKGSYLDLSIHEAVASMLEYKLGVQASPGDHRPDEDFSVLRACDGYVLIPLLRSWDTLIELVASDAKGGGLFDQKWEDPGFREQNFKRAVKAVEDWTIGHTRREIMELGQAMRFPWAAVDSVDEVPENPQLKSRQFFVHFQPSEIASSRPLPGIPFKSRESPNKPQRPAPSLGEHTHAVMKEFEGKEREGKGARAEGWQCPEERILEGMRVIDLTRMISGPYATRICADFGAEVIKIQSRQTAQGAEQNDTPFFSLWNRNKRSVDLDLSSPTARDTLLKLVAESDILMENFSPRVMLNWGLEYERLREVNPSLIMVSVSAMGQTGPRKDFVGFAPTFHALSGLISSASGAGNLPSDLGYPYADVVTGLYAALTAFAALEYRDQTGKGQHIDLSALEATCTFDSLASVEKQSPAGSYDLTTDSQLLARRFFVQLRHSALGSTLSVRTPLWDWHRKPRWKPSPLLGI